MDIKLEIEKRIKEHYDLLEKDNTLVTEAMLKGSLSAYEYMLSFIESQEPEGLDNATKEYCDEHNDDCFDAVGDICPHLPLAFKAGARWESPAYNMIKKVLAIGFMHTLDEIRPDGKMCLSNGECMDIEKAFNERDWDKLERYLKKYTNVSTIKERD